MLRTTNQRPLLAYFEAIKGLRLRQIATILKAGYDPNLLLNSRGQNGLQFMVHYFAASESHMMRLELPGARSAYLGISRLLLDAGLEPNSCDLLTGDSVIFDAVRLQDRDLVQLLLPYVDLSLRNKEGETVLMCAARFGNTQTMRLILAHLHELNLDEFYLRQRNRFGFTSLDLARAENPECAKLLAKHLIALDQPRTSLLTRSSSHHQLNLARQALLRRPTLGVGRGKFGSSQVALAGLLDVDPLVSDYDSEPLSPVVSSSQRRSNGLSKLDQRAAEFNRFLMDRGHEPAYVGQWAAGGAASSDEDVGLDEGGLGEELGLYQSAGGGYNRHPTGMTRSRSTCNLGPGAASSGGGGAGEGCSKPSQAGGRRGELGDPAAGSSGGASNLPKFSSGSMPKRNK